MFRRIEIFVAALVLVGLGIGQTHAASPFKVIDPPSDWRPVKDNVVRVGGKYVDQIIFDDYEMLIQYRNQTGVRMKPDVKVVVYDKYGLPVSRGSDRWLTSLEKNDVDSNKVFCHDYDLPELLKHASVEIPKDAGVPRYADVQE